MPAKRLPWIKFWPELLEHRKFGELTDAESWTWVVVWGKASQQPNRWNFASIDHASRVTGRPRRQIQRLIDVKLVDVNGDGSLVIHDIKQWQERFPSDDPEDPSNGPSTLREDSVNTPRSLLERSVNGGLNAPSNLREGSAEDSVNAPPEKRDERRETLSPPIVPPSRGDRTAVPKPKVERVPISDEDVEDLVGKYAERYGSRQAVRDEIDQALNHQARFKAIRERLYVDGWLRRELDHRPAGLRLLTTRANQPRHDVDRTGVAN